MRIPLDGTYKISYTASPTLLTKRVATIMFNESRQNIPAGEYYRDAWWKDIDASTQGLVPKATEAANAARFTLSDGDQLTGYDAKLKIYHAKITGKITNRAGKPLAGIYVRQFGKALASQTVHEANGMITGADGIYTLWLEPHVQDGTWWAVHAEPRNSVAYHPRWYDNVLAQLGTTMGLVVQASQATVKHFTLGSEEVATGVDISLTENRPDTLTINFAKPKKKGSKTIVAAGRLNPSHDPRSRSRRRSTSTTRRRRSTSTSTRPRLFRLRRACTRTGRSPRPSRARVPSGCGSRWAGICGGFTGRTPRRRS